MRGMKRVARKQMKLEPSGLVAHDTGTSLLVLNKAFTFVFFIAQRVEE
jgi:hypothetical protein